MSDTLLTLFSADDSKEHYGKRLLTRRDDLRPDPGTPGVIARLIDLADNAAVAVKIGRTAPTINLRIDYLRAASGSDLTATAKLIQSSHSVERVNINIPDDDGRQIAIGRGTYSAI